MVHASSIVLAASAFAAAVLGQAPVPDSATAGTMDGYLGVPQQRVPEEFGGGFACTS